MSKEENRRSKICGMLGLSMRAGKLVIGTENVCVMLKKSKKIELVLVSAGASEATKKKIFHKCEFYNVNLKTLPIDTDELGRLLGKTYAPACVGVSDVGFASCIAKLISDGESNNM